MMNFIQFIQIKCLNLKKVFYISAWNHLKQNRPHPIIIQVKQISFP